MKDECTNIDGPFVVVFDDDAIELFNKFCLPYA